MAEKLDKYAEVGSPRFNWWWMQKQRKKRATDDSAVDRSIITHDDQVLYSSDNMLLEYGAPIREPIDPVTMDPTVVTSDGFPLESYDEILLEFYKA